MNNKLIKQFKVPIVYFSLVWLLFLLDLKFEINNLLALYPRELFGLTGVVTMVFSHANLEHVLGNSLPLALGLFLLYSFYEKSATMILFIGHFFTGLLIWIIARPSYHIGASGVVYMLVAFILIASFLSQNKQFRLAALALLSIQSGLIFGILPQANQISWEGHLSGAIVGFLLAFIFKSKGPKPDKPFVWNEELSEATDEYKRFEN